VSVPPLTVLGSGGFVGGALVRHARAQGLDVATPPRDATLWHAPLGHVVFCIGLTADFRTRPLDTVEAHVCVLRELLAHGRFESLTYLSSTRVYAGGTDTRESAALQVNSNDASDLYNLSKLTGESMCLHGGRPRCKVARLSNVVGPRADPDTFIDQLLLEARCSGHATLRTAASARKDYIALDDAVALLLRIATLPTASGIYNVASGEATANATVAALLGEVAGITVRLPADLPADLPAALPTALPTARPAWDFPPIDTQRVRDEFGFSPRPFATHFTEFLRAHAAPVAQKATA